MIRIYLDEKTLYVFFNVKVNQTLNNAFIKNN